MLAGLHRHSALRIATGLALALTLGACKGKEEKGTPLGAAPQENATRLAMPAEGRASLDEGNELFRQKKYDEALAKYRLAAEEMPTSSAPWFGISMVATKLNNKALADSAQAKIKAISPEAPLADSQLQQMHEKAAEGGMPPATGAMPAGHPPMTTKQ
jgi:hypothetical protein